QDQRVYSAMASQLAAVVDAIRSSEALKTAQQETELLYNFSSRLAGAKTRQELLAGVSDYIISQGGTGANLLYLDLDKQGVPEWGELVAEISLSKGGLPIGTRFKLTDFGIANLWMSSPEKPLLINDTQDVELIDETTRAIYAQIGQKASVILPLYLQG